MFIPIKTIPLDTRMRTRGFDDVAALGLGDAAPPHPTTELRDAEVGFLGSTTDITAVLLDNRQQVHPAEGNLDLVLCLLIRKL